jgi:hypothetical protein
MGGIGILIIFCGYVWLSIFLVRTVHRWQSVPKTVAAALLIIMLPFVDAVAGRALLRHKCEADGQIIIKESIPDIEGIALQYGVSESDPSHYGYNYIEGGLIYKSPWMLDRIKSDGMGNVSNIEKNIELKSKYMLDEKSLEDSTYFYKKRISVKEIRSGRELSGFNWYRFHGGWAERILMAFSDAGPSSVAECGKTDEQLNKELALLHKTLIPAPLHTLSW